MRNATDIFSEWALGGKDEGMEKNHADAVSEMLTHLTYGIGTSFTFIDAGCGNGWAVRKMKDHPLCKKAIGVDGAEDMIRKANAIDAVGNRNVDQPIFAGQGNRRLGALASQRKQARPASSAHNDRENRLGIVIKSVIFGHENDLLTGQSPPTMGQPLPVTRRDVLTLH